MIVTLWIDTDGCKSMMDVEIPPKITPHMLIRLLQQSFWLTEDAEAEGTGYLVDISSNKEVWTVFSGDSWINEETCSDGAVIRIRKSRMA